MPRPRRSALFMPGSNARALDKARGIACDTILFDLEDSVAVEQKALARDQVAAVIRAGGYGERELVVRVNPLGSALVADDIRMAVGAGAHAVLLPKTESAADVLAVEQALAEAPPAMGIFAMVETPRAILAVAEIAARAEGGRLQALAVGPNDLAKMTGVRAGADRAPMLSWLSQVVLAAKAYGLSALDGVYNNFQDEDGFAAECRQGRALGFDGKTLIHPRQVEPANALFGASAEEVAWARRIVAAFAEPAHAAANVINLDGRMVERLHLEEAQALLASIR
ncbi:CoA ester lyase [Roseomonas stagni]|uniref:CoA ester lyase n=1 Tax=Falsiroseomonas algicola TaxID=2716930 RepID=A0A6M1LKB0_9PROT|nr:CoA ester lyase [Falsiroseomonas algicola]NGM20760.1 CoA ester lyase [Falsiroseomonas algicola]